MPAASLKSIGQFIGTAFGAYLGWMLLAQLQLPSRNVAIQPEAPTVNASAIPREGTEWPPKLILAIKKLPPRERARATQFLKELEFKGWDGASPELRDEFTDLFVDNVMIDQMKMALQARCNSVEWAKLSPDKRKWYTSLLEQMYMATIKETLATSKEKWDSLNTQHRIIKCDIVKCYLQAIGATDVEISRYAVFLGDFMSAAASHVTIKDSLFVFCDQIGQQRRAKNLAALNEIVDLSLAGAQLLQVISQPSE
ncbi:hypothetical protein [Lacipirellula parvula]|uniref:Uncharacterized protein n=1 Tax=Lacipirellula parvula TaxID=2650471 RepID=A0A5K7XED4_9BACT|nr:hypothetical protein [Lacipirellula parvula]BBO35224.1 hypothetical protein PLANPX_4836 [Lacipirellula parvula]